MLVCAGVLQIVLGTTLALTHLPLCDEGFYGVGAQQLTLTGSLRNPVIESAGVEYLRGIDQVFYWIVPLAMVLQLAEKITVGQMIVMATMGFSAFWIGRNRSLESTTPAMSFR
jgi:hypothetical protein